MTVSASRDISAVAELLVCPGEPASITMRTMRNIEVLCCKLATAAEQTASKRQ